MAAPKGNQFWKLRNKHGRDKLFASPQLMWEAACEYFEWCDNNPWVKNEVIKGGDMAGTIVAVPTTRPYTLSGFMFYAGAEESYWRHFKAEGHHDYSPVIKKIEAVIDTQQFEGASVGAFNANIIARKLGLADRSDITSGGERLSLKIEVLKPDTAEEINKL